MSTLVVRVVAVLVALGVVGAPATALARRGLVVPGDYPTIQAVILLFSFVYVLINLLIDLSYTLLDPRIRY